jgi:endonuclease/exonuclease/phosphatase family metal-dependent hydrolase
MQTILLGDLNEWRRRSRSALNVLEPTFGHAPSILSFPSRRPFLPLDCILGWPRGFISGVAIHDSPPARHASDHLPMVATASLAPTTVELQHAA